MPLIAYVRTLYTRIFFRSKIFFIFVALALLANALIWSLIILGFDTLYQEEREFIPLHYKVLVGPDLYSNWYWIFTLPVAGLLFIVFNFYFGRFVYQKVRIGTFFLSVASLLTQLILLRAVYLIIQINLY